MRYATPTALRAALEHRLLACSTETGVSLDRLRRRVLFERIIARLHAAEPGRWVLKGGMALEVRLRDDARVTNDIDLGLRDRVSDASDLHERLVDALTEDPDRDAFVLEPGRPARLSEDGDGFATWRLSVTAILAGKRFGAVKLSSMPCSATSANARTREFVTWSTSSSFSSTTCSNRVPCAPAHGRSGVSGTVANRRPLADLPTSWPARYEALAADHDLMTQSFPTATALVDRLWAEMFSTSSEPSHGDSL